MLVLDLSPKGSVSPFHLKVVEGGVFLQLGEAILRMKKCRLITTRIHYFAVAGSYRFPRVRVTISNGGQNITPVPCCCQQISMKLLDVCCLLLILLDKKVNNFA